MKAVRSYALALVMMLFVSSYLTAGPARPAPHRRAVLTASDHVAGEYVVILAKPIAAKDIGSVTASLGTRYHAEVVSVWKDAVQGFWARMSKENAAALANDRRVESVEENARFYTSANPPTDGDARPQIRGTYPIDPNGHPLWHLTRISHRSRADDDLHYPYMEGVNDGSDVRIYVIDTGVNRYHQEFFSDAFIQQHPAIATDAELVAALTADQTPRVVDVPAVNGLPGSNPSNDGWPATEPRFPCDSTSHWWTGALDVAHGTACGSLVGGRNVGVARGATIIPVKVVGCGDVGTATTASLIEGINFVVSHEAIAPANHGAVITMSTFRTVQGEGCPSDTCVRGDVLHNIESAIETALRNGITVVASANNQNSDACNGTPARLSRHGGKGRVITVGGLSKAADTMWVETTTNGSNHGQCVDIWAPAENIAVAMAADWSAYRSTAASGTSFSAPIVAGIVARLLSEDPTLNTRDSATVDKVWNRLAETATHAERMGRVIHPDSTGLIAYIGATTVRQTETHSGQQTTSTVHADFLPAAATPAYAWYRGEPGDIEGSTSLNGSGATYTTPAGETGTYWARVSFQFNNEHLFADSPGSTITSCDLAISAQPHDLWIDGSSAAQLTLAATSSSPIHYAWYRGYPGDTSVPLPGDSSSLTLPTQQSETERYWVRVTAEGCPVPIDSAVALVRLCTPVTNFSLTTATIPAWKDVFTVTALGVNSLDVLYRWYHGEVGNKQFPLGESTPLNSVTTARNYVPAKVWATASSPCGAEVQSANAVDAALCTAPARVTSPANRTILPGQPTVLWARITDYDPGSDVVRWYRTSGGAETEIGSGQALHINAWDPPAPGTTAAYRAEVKRFECPAPEANFSISRTSGDVAGCGRDPILGQPTASFLPESNQWKLQVSVAPAANQSILSYEWRSGADYDDTTLAIPGDSDVDPQLGSSRLVSPNGPATYWVRIRYRCGSSAEVINEDSAPVVAVCPTPSVTITTIPQSGHINHSTFPTLVANGTGTGLVYNWYRGALHHTDRFEATAPAVSPYVPGPSETFWVQAVDACGHIAEAGPVTISICVPAITQQPVDTTIDPGEEAVLTVAADSANASPLNYQWYAGAQSQTLFPVAGGTGPTLLVHPSATTQYWVAVTGSCSDGSAMVESTTAQVTVRPCVAPAITTPPASISIAGGDSVNLTVGATGTNLTYQWYEDAGTGNPVAGATSASLTAWPPASTSYWCRVTGMCGTADSALAQIDVCAPPSIETQPQSATINSGGSTTLSVTPYLDLNAGPIAYHWYQGMVGDKSTPVGADSPTFTTPALTATTRYWVALTTGVCETDSQQVTISMCALPAVAATGTSSVRKNQSVTLTLSPNPGTSGITYQWYRGASGNTSNPIAGATAASTTVTVSATGDYWCRVTGGSCFVNSSALTVSVCIPNITTQPAGGSVSDGQTLVLTVASDLPSSTYQWYRGVSGNTSSPVSGATAASYTAGPGPTTSYWVRVTGSCGSTDSNAATVNCVIPSISSNPTGMAITRGQTINLTVAANGSGLTYQWYQGAGTASPYGGATSATLTATPQVSTAYWCRVTGSCGTADSALAQVDVCSAPVLSTQPQSQTINSGQTATLSVSVQANALNPAPHYHWYRGTVGDRSTTVGGDSAVFTTPALTAATSYWVAVNAGQCETPSAQATISMCALPAVTATGPASIQKGQVITLSLSPNPGTSGITYQWYTGASGNTSSPITSATAYAVTMQPQATTSYWCRVTNATCSVNSTAVTANVCIPQITAQPAGTSSPINNGQTWTMTVATDVGASTVQWYRGTPGNTTSPVAGATAASVTVNPSVTTTYFARVTGPCGYTADSNAATVAVCVPPTISGHPTGTSITRGQTVNLTVTAAGTGLTYQWYQGAGTGSPYGGGGNSATLTAMPQVPTSYWCRVSNSCGTADSQPAQVDVCATPIINAQPLSQTVADGGTANLSVTATQPTGMARHYQWYRSTTGNPINPVGADSPTYTTSAITAQTSYFVHITSGNCSLDSATATISTCPLPVMQTIGGGTVPRYQTVLLRVTPAPEDVTFTFYEGPVGDTSNFVGGGGIQSTLYITASHNAQYWARVENGICHVDTAATTVTVY